MRTAAAVLGRSTRAALPLCPHRNASTAAAAAIEVVEPASSFQVPGPSADIVKEFDPVARSRLRRRGKRELPPSRYQYRSPKYSGHGSDSTTCQLRV